MKLEPTLHKALLAGAARVPLTPESVAAPALQALLASVPDEARLWHSVAATDLWQRAGFEPGRAEAAAPSSPDDERVVSRAAEQALQLILRDIHPELLGNWLTQARAMNATLPHACLVPLIELAVQKSALRPAVMPLLGARGAWLIAQQADWAKAFGVDMTGAAPAATWELGSLPQRVEALLALRRADPAAALALLEADWAQEPYENRVTLLPCLATGIGQADEAFIERALDDKRKEVRAAAQQLLAALPDSQLAERCKARLLALMTFERTAIGPALTVKLPQELDKAMKRDGIGGHQYHHRMGEKAGWLMDLMRCVPPAFWSAQWSMTPPEVIDMLSRQEFNTALVTGLTEATARALAARVDENTTAWFLALIGDKSLRSITDIAAMLLPDLTRLPAAQQERIVTRWLADAGNDEQAFAYAMRWAEQHEGGVADSVSPLLSRELLAKLQRQMLSVPSQRIYLVRNDFNTLARVLDATDLSYARANWPLETWEHWPAWRPVVDNLLETLTFRHTMQASFLENDA